MTDNYKSEYKDTDGARKVISRYNTFNLIRSIGIFTIILSIIPYLLITSEVINDRIIPAVIVFVIGLILAFMGNWQINRIKEKNDGRYTVGALEFVSAHRKENNKIFKRDLIIGILLVIILPFIYYLMHFRATFIPENVDRYLTSILILGFAIAIFLIFHSKGKKDAYKIFDQKTSEY